MKGKELKITRPNAQFQILAALKTNREKRNKEGFLFEGVRNINNAVKHGWRITAFVYSSEKGLSKWARDILNNNPARIRYDCSPDILSKLSDKEEPSELLAVADMRTHALESLKVKDPFLVVVFDRPSSPGNLGTLIRSCDAFGADALIVTGHAADVYDPETIRATTGSLFALPIFRLPSQKELMPWIEEMKRTYSDLQIVGTDERGEETIYKHDFKRPTILLAGNEKLGLSAGYREILDSMVSIPMEGSASSLNVAVATSVVLSEIKRQRSA